MTRYAHRPLTAARTYSHGLRLVPPTTETCTDDGGIDWIAVERAATGDYDPTLLNLDERWAATHLLLAAGLGEPAIAERLATNKRQIHRWRHTDYRPSQRPRPAQTVSPCGTDAAYRRHQRRGEPIDDACRDGMREHWQQQRNRLKAAA
ncbi:hypothetical protein [Streptomyces axinellae]|uniref:Helix-turn-helix domain-containing protein n=1 Tax=Streptomyces axinellae TaxID=552788 RepID=A0ABN3QMF7_9ACTN